MNKIITIIAVATLLAAGCTTHGSAAPRTTPSKTATPTPTVLLDWRGHDTFKEGAVSDRFTVPNEAFTIRYKIDCTNSPNPVDDPTIKLGLSLPDPAQGALDDKPLIPYGRVASAKPTGTVKAHGPGEYQLVMLTTCGPWSIQAVEGAAE